jgi:hypothetical protein
VHRAEAGHARLGPVVGQELPLEVLEVVIEVLEAAGAEVLLELAKEVEVCVAPVLLTMTFRRLEKTRPGQKNLSQACQDGKILPGIHERPYVGRGCAWVHPPPPIKHNRQNEQLKRSTKRSHIRRRPPAAAVRPCLRTLNPKP